ncbi:DnaJ chaperone (Caj1) [Penicillium malachiteum]|nr:DnaJ chaperone (Caj1) [Penicillium malachiteum]KAJ5736698.1 DnaJ chaperone (Caj1) [Penicillium malachiteum]
MTKNLDYYKILGVSKDATAQEIRTAYKRYASKRYIFPTLLNLPHHRDKL